METEHHLLLPSAPAPPAPPYASSTSPSPSSSATAMVGKLHTFERLHAEGFAYLADNSYIRSGYRLHYSARDCVLSLFELHNETLNVWTHMMGSFIFAVLMLYLALSGHALAPASDSSARANLTDYVPPAASMRCATGDALYLRDGRHTARLLLTVTLPELCPLPPSARSAEAPAKYYDVASAVLEHSLQRFHALLEPNVGGFSDSVAAPIEQLRHELGALSARLSARVLRDVPPSEHVQSLKRQLDDRVESLSEYVRDVGADGPVKYVLEELQAVAESVRSGLHLLAADEGPHDVPHWPLFVFLASAVICLSCSATFHLMFVVSRSAYTLLSRLDYAGITILIAGSFYPMIYYSFYCYPWQRSVYLVVISTLAALTFTVALLPVFGTPKFLVARTCIFLALGFFGVVPVTHLVWRFGLSDPHVTIMIGPLLLMGLLYTSGAIIYATKFPERFYPGRFDLWFSSHQLWHICVVAAALVHFANALQQYEWRWNTQCEA